jgi:hypothetical protein
MTATKQGHLPLRPSPDVCHQVGLNDVIWKLMIQCWQMDPADRPIASGLVQTLSCHLESRGHGVPACHWDETVVQLRASLVEDHLSTKIFSEDPAEG